MSFINSLHTVLYSTWCGPQHSFPSWHRISSSNTEWVQNGEANHGTFNTKRPQFVYSKESVLIQYLLTSSSQRWSVQVRKSHSKQPPPKHYRIQIIAQLNPPEKKTVENCCQATQANISLRKFATTNWQLKTKYFNQIPNIAIFFLLRLKWQGFQEWFNDCTSPDWLIHSKAPTHSPPAFFLFPYLVTGCSPQISAWSKERPFWFYSPASPMPKYAQLTYNNKNWRPWQKIDMIAQPSLLGFMEKQSSQACKVK